MSGVSRRQVFERTGIVVVVAGVHASAISIAAQRKIELSDEADRGPLIIELVQDTQRPIELLQALEGRYSLAEAPTPKLIIPPPSQALPNPLPNTKRSGATGEPDNGGGSVSAERGQSQTAGDPETVFPMPTPSAQAALLSAICGRLSDEQGTTCDTFEGERGAVLGASLTQDPWEADSNMLPASLDFVATQPVFASLSVGQGDRFATSPYRAGAPIKAVVGNAWQARLSPSAPVSQATRDMSGRINALPHEVWGD